VKSKRMIITVLQSLLAASNLSGQGKQPITPRDCVTVRHIFPLDMTASWRWPIKMSPDGHSAAYLAESPNLQTNENDVELYIRQIPGDTSVPSHLVLTGDMTDFAWSSDGRAVVALIKKDGRREIDSVNIATGETQLLVRANTDIDEFSIDESGNRVVYTTQVSDSLLGDEPTAQQIARGYRIPFGDSDEAGWPHSSVFVTMRIGGVWTTPSLIKFTSPFTGEPMTTLARISNGPLMPTLSPDGSKVLVSYMEFSPKMPDVWRDSDYMRLRNTTGMIQAFRLVLLYDLKTEQTSVPLKTPWVLSPPLWSPDSESFVVVGKPEVGSAAEHEAMQRGTLAHSRGALLLAVDLDSDTTSIVSSDLAFPWEAPLEFGRNGTVLARVGTLDTFTSFALRNGSWVKTESTKVPLQLTVAPIAANQEYAIGEYSNATTPPELFDYIFGKQDVDVFAKMNPQFDHLSIAKPIEVEWKTPEGFEAKGTLLLPPNYDKGIRYPLVIHTKPFDNGFVCSFGNYPSFAPQPIANAGIMYLGPGFPGEKTESKAPQNASDYFPKGYPAGITEAALNMDVWDSAVRALSDRGLIDENKVGIIGFSRTGWYTEFMLAHSKIHYRAATVADNVQYSLGEYWLAHDAGTMKTYDNTYGGPPYGATLKNWLDFSVSFNLDKFHTPLLMEEMGYGDLAADSSKALPISLAGSYEVFSGLNRLGKPVELYYYPNEGHTPEHPQARLATMQRNLDWYRFWLQGYERPNPEDASQYLRWEKLRDIQRIDDMRSDDNQGKSGSPSH
jgi:dipeptidyl aminopeptidase/acylaminoacyl peptidase